MKDGKKQRKEWNEGRKEGGRDGNKGEKKVVK